MSRVVKRVIDDVSDETSRHTPLEIPVVEKNVLISVDKREFLGEDAVMYYFGERSKRV